MQHMNEGKSFRINHIMLKKTTDAKDFRFYVGRRSKSFRIKYARVAKPADAKDLKSFEPKGSCGFESRPGHQRAYHAPDSEEFQTRPDNSSRRRRQRVPVPPTPGALFLPNCAATKCARSRISLASFSLAAGCTMRSGRGRDTCAARAPKRDTKKWHERTHTA